MGIIGRAEAGGGAIGLIVTLLVLFAIIISTGVELNNFAVAVIGVATSRMNKGTFKVAVAFAAKLGIVHI